MSLVAEPVFTNQKALKELILSAARNDIVIELSFFETLFCAAHIFVLICLSKINQTNFLNNQISNQKGTL